jgi:hypothetical protein
MRKIDFRGPDVRYARDLVEAGLDGAASALRRTNAAAAPALKDTVWAPAAVGAIVGLLGACSASRRKSGYHLALGGLVGTALGFGCAVAWQSRGRAETAARGAIDKIATVRDARWLEKNPVAYA